VGSDLAAEMNRLALVGSLALAALMFAPAVATAQGAWVLVRPPLDYPRLEALNRDAAFLAKSPYRPPFADLPA
jgi:hypothetical protein